MACHLVYGRHSRGNPSSGRPSPLLLATFQGAMMEAFRYLNPFEKASVHEDDVWGEQRQNPFDVETIHADVSQVLINDLRRLKAAPGTRVRFLVGPPGIGKSHLFSRLRRQIGG